MSKYIEVSRFDAEVALAEGITHIPVGTDHCETGVAVYDYLKKLGYVIVKEKVV